MTILQDQTGQTGGGDTEGSDTSHPTTPCIEGGYLVDNEKSTMIQPVQPGFCENVGEGTFVWS